MSNTKKTRWMTLLVVATLVSTLPASSLAQADVVTSWNTTACEIAQASKLHPALTSRALALVQTAVYEAVNAITKRYPSDRVQLAAASDASVDAAVAATTRTVLVQVLPSQQAMIDEAYQAALAAIPNGHAKTAGLTVGEHAAAAILASRAEDGAATEEAYRPSTAAGVYVATALPIASQWPQRTPWLMTSPTQFRPDPPPMLTSQVWVRDYNEVKTLGGKNSTSRTAEQTTIARFWEIGGPGVYHGVARAVATRPGREVTQNARLFAAVTQATDDALIAVFDAKYHYALWRPITAIRNGDIDGNDATEREAAWQPLLDTPPHPEYPCAHCAVAATLGTVLQAESGTSPLPTLTTTSLSIPGATRRWTTTDEFIAEVAAGRIYAGAHYRTSVDAGTVIGKKLAQLAAAKYFPSLK